MGTPAESHVNNDHRRSARHPGQRIDRGTNKGGMAMPRTPLEVFAHHAQAVGTGNIEDIVANFADDAVFITPDRALHGKDGVRAGFAQLFSDLPNATFEVTSRVQEGDVLYLEWSAESPTVRADNGVDTFVYREGEIWLQTVRYSLHAKD
jgi:hypothetical protein